MKKFSEEEWNAFQERVKLASLGEKTHGANHFTVAFNVWTHPDSSVSIQKISNAKYFDQKLDRIMKHCEVKEK